MLISVFSFCLSYCIWGPLSAGWKAIVPINHGVCLLWVGLDQYLLNIFRLEGLVSVFWWVELNFVSLKSRAASSGLFWDVCGFCMALDRLSTNGKDGVPILQMVWHEGVQHWSLLTFGWGLVLVLRWRPLEEFLSINVPWCWGLYSGPMSWTRSSTSEVQGQPLTLAVWLHKPPSTEDKEKDI